MTEILYVDTEGFTAGDFDSYLSLLPAGAREKALSCRDFEARKNRLFTRLLLQKMYGPGVMLKENGSGKPYLVRETGRASAPDAGRTCTAGGTDGVNEVRISEIKAGGFAGGGGLIQKTPSPPADALPYFSISHSGNIAACAFSDCEAGFDVEYMRRGRDVVPLAERFFTKEETCYVAGSKDRSAAFYYIWTRKEAFLKAAGIGLRVKLSAFSVLEEGTPEIITAPGAPAAVKFPGFLKSVSLREDYAAALCIAGGRQTSAPSAGP